MESVHAVTRAKAGGAGDVLASAEEREAAQDLAGKLGWGALHRLWQMLLKGLTDVQIAPDQHEAASMALLRVIHAAELPDPAAVLQRLQNGGAVASRAPAAQAPSAAPAMQASAEPDAPADFRALVDRLEQGGKALLAQQLHDHVSLVRFAPGELTIKPLRPLGGDFLRNATDALRQALGSKWTVSLSDEEGEPSLLQQEKMAQERAEAAILAEPNVAAVLAAFPGATLETVTQKGA